MHGNRQRLDHRGLVQADRLGDFECHGGPHRKILLGGAAGLKTHHAEMVANVIHALAARVAGAASNLGHDDHGVAGGESAYPGPHRFHGSGNLVALDHGIRGVGVPAVVNVDIRSAHADPPDTHQHFVVGRDGFGDLPELDRAGHGHDRLSHHVFF